MKLFKLLIICVLATTQSCKTQQNQTKNTIPKIANYKYGELDIKVTTLGEENAITIGKIHADGTILFNWQPIEDTILKENMYSLSPIKTAVGMLFCNDKKITENTIKNNVVEAKNLFLFKKGKMVGALIAATDKKIEDNKGINKRTSLVLGSSLSWVYSVENANFIASCNVNMKWEDSYDFKETTNYNIHLKKGWNMIEHILLEKKDWTDKKSHGSLPKTMIKKTVVNIPSKINWYVKYW